MAQLSTGVAISFNKSGLKMYVGHDTTDAIFEFDLVCPFNIIEGKCPPITENKDRTGILEAQIDIAKRTIEYSTDSALNRLRWIRRNKDNQNLSNLNIDYNLNIPQIDNPLLNTLIKKIPEKITAHQASFKKEVDNKKQDVFYWSEGSISVGKVGDTNVSTSKEINANSLTIGADKFTDNNGIIGWALRYGNDHTKVGYIL